MLASHPMIFEPMVSCIVCVPEECMSAVYGDLNQRRFRVTNARKMNFHQIEGTAPLSEVLDLLPNLALWTGGTAYCSMHPEGYEKLPESLTTVLYCASCLRDMRIPLLSNMPITEKCLICGTPFDSPDPDAWVPVLKR